MQHIGTAFEGSVGMFVLGKTSGFVGELTLPSTVVENEDVPLTRAQWKAAVLNTPLDEGKQGQAGRGDGRQGQGQGRCQGQGQSLARLGVIIRGCGDHACSPFESPWASAGSLILLFSCSTLAPLLRYRCIAPTLPPTFDLSSEMTFASFDPQK